MNLTAFDLTSVAGIVGATSFLVGWLKPTLARVPVLRELPVMLHATLVSALLTWLAHDVLHTLQGDLPVLLSLVVGQALMAAGVREQKEAGIKPVKLTSAGREAVAADYEDDRDWRLPVVLLVAVLALGVSACAGKARAVAVQVDQTAVAVLGAVQDGADKLVADGVITTEQRRAIAPALLHALKLADDYNRAVRFANESPLKVAGALLDALRTLKLDLTNLLPKGLPIDLVGMVTRAIGLVPDPGGFEFAAAGSGGRQ